MKKCFVCILIFCLLVQLAGCSLIPASSQETTTPPETTLPTAAPTEESTQPEPSAEGSDVTVQLPLASVALPVITEPATAADGTVIFNYTYQNIALIAPDPAVADLVIIDFLTRMDATRDTASDIHALAESAYNGSENWSPYLCMVSYEPKRIDAGILSLLGAQASYYGTRHPETVYTAVSYDLITGEILKLNDILAPDGSVDTLLQGVLEALSARQQELYLFGDYEDTVRQLFAGSSIQSTWYFSNTGLCFYFAPTEFAPYTSGVVAAEIPYDQLAGVIDDAFFPAERDTAAGTVEVQLFTQADLESYSRFSEVVLDAEGDKILLHADKPVHNIRIETGSWSSTGAFYTPQHTVFAASGLSTGDAIMVQALLSESTPALRLSYDTSEETVQVFIAKSSDGTIILTQE